MVLNHWELFDLLDYVDCLHDLHGHVLVDRHFEARIRVVLVLIKEVFWVERGGPV